MSFHSPWVGTDTPGPGEAVFCYQIQLKPMNFKEKEETQNLNDSCFLFFAGPNIYFSLNTIGFPLNLIAKAASPGPGVLVPTQGSWKFIDFLKCL